MRQDMTSNDQNDIQVTDQQRTGQGKDCTSRQSSSRVSVYDAANALGVTVDAIRKRIQRGTIPHERHEDGRVYVLLDAARTLQDESSKPSSKVRDDDQDEGQVRYRTDEFVESLQDQIGFLRRELERKDAILMRMAERIPELESPRPNNPTEWLEDEEHLREEAGKSTRTDEERQQWHERAHAAPRKEPSQQPEGRSWWRRFFGFG